MSHIPATRRVVGLIAVVWWAAACAGAAPASPGPTRSQPATPGGAASADPTTAVPPEAVLVTGDGAEVTGSLGGYTYGAAGSDSPWLSGSGLPSAAVAAGEPLTIGLTDGSRPASVQAVVASETDPQGEHPTPLSAEPTPTGARVTAPGDGSWVLSVTVEYADGLGSGAYYWRLEVR
jgi:hypothetical protein